MVRTPVVRWFMARVATTPPKEDVGEPEHQGGGCDVVTREVGEHHEAAAGCGWIRTSGGCFLMPATAAPTRPTPTPGEIATKRRAAVSPHANGTCDRDRSLTSTSPPASAM